MLKFSFFIPKTLPIIKSNFFFEKYALYFINKFSFILNIFCLLVLEKYIVDFFFRSVLFNQNYINTSNSIYSYKNTVYFLIKFFFFFLYIFFIL